MNDNLLEISHLKVVYTSREQTIHAVNDVSFSLKKLAQGRAQLPMRLCDFFLIGLPMFSTEVYYLKGKIS